MNSLAYSSSQLPGFMRQPLSVPLDRVAMSPGRYTVGRIWPRVKVWCSPSITTLVQQRAKSRVYLRVLQGQPEAQGRCSNSPSSASFAASDVRQGYAEGPVLPGAYAFRVGLVNAGDDGIQSLFQRQVQVLLDDVLQCVQMKM